MLLEDAFKIGSKIYGGIAKTIGTCVIFYMAFCAVVLVSEHKKSQKKHVKATNSKMVEVRGEITKKAEKNASEDRAYVAKKAKSESEVPLTVITTNKSEHKA